MSPRPRHPRLAAVLWFVAAGLSFVAVGIRFFQHQGANWGAMACGLMFSILGIVTLARKGQTPPAA